MNLSLPSTMKKWVDRQVEDGQFSSASEFVRHVLRQSQARSTRQGIDAALLEALAEGKSKPMTRADWDEIRRDGRARLARLTRAGTKRRKSA